MTGPGRPGDARLYLERDLPSITDEEFELFQALVYREAGIYLSEAKKALVMGRLGKRVRELGLRTYGAYYRYAAREHRPELTRLLDAITTNETHFFRDAEQFDYLREDVLPRWEEEAREGRRPRRIRAWSAACSTGQEPYTLAMVLLDYFSTGSGWTIDILGTDLSTEALARAKAATWPIEQAKAIPPRFRTAFMLKGVRRREGMIKAGPEIRSVVRFQHLNLNDERYPVRGPFDLIFCRNVLIYFDAASKARVVHRLIDQLAPTGYLLVSYTESLGALTDRVRTVRPMVYAPRADDAGPARNGRDEPTDANRAEPVTK